MIFMHFCSHNAWLRIAYAIVLSELFIYVCTFPCVVTVFFWFVIVKSMMRLFSLLYFGFLYPVCACVLRNYLHVWLLDRLNFDITYIFAWFPYFLRWFYDWLHCFFWQITNICYSLLFCEFLPVSLPRFWCFLWGVPAFLLHCRPAMIILVICILFVR